MVTRSCMQLKHDIIIIIYSEAYYNESTAGADASVTLTCTSFIVEQL